MPERVCITQNMSKHTREPWSSKGAVVTKSNGFKIRLDRPRGAAPEAWGDIAEGLNADAARIANCVNALAGTEQPVEAVVAAKAALRLAAKELDRSAALREPGLFLARSEVGKALEMLGDPVRSAPLSTTAVDF